MLRTIQMLACLFALCFVAGCKEEVKEIPASDSTSTPTMSDDEKKELQSGTQKHDSNRESTKSKSKSK